MNKLTLTQQSLLIEKLKQKKTGLIGLLEKLAAFEITHGVELWVIGSVAECGYWLDSDLDVFLDENCKKEVWQTWLDLDAEHGELDAIFNPKPEFKTRILESGERPSEVIAKLNLFDSEQGLIEQFAKRRHDKILQTLDNSAYFIDRLEGFKSMIANGLNKFEEGVKDQAFSRYLERSYLQSVYVENVAFRFVWVSLMVLSRYEHLLEPIGPEIKDHISARDWLKWVDELAHSRAGRPAFMIQQAALIEDFYQAMEFEQTLDDDAQSDESIDVTARLNEWVTAYWCFDRDTREWLAKHWTFEI